MWTLATTASAVIPGSIVTASAPMITRVVAALRLLGSSKAGTPLETASTPVSAVHPDANARKARKTSARPAACVSGWTPYAALSAVNPLPNTILPRPTSTSRTTATTKAYVGTANARPDSFTPRRLTTVRRAIAASESATAWSASAGTALVTAATPATTDTATVRT